MSQFSWTYDAPSGVYKNHALSSKLREAAVQMGRFVQFADVEPGYGKKKGESVTMVRVSNLNLPTSGKLTENQRVPEDEITLSTKAITVSEWGRAVPYTSLAQDLGKFEPSNYIQRALMKQKMQIMDDAAAAAITSSDVKVKAIPDGAGSITFDTDGTASTAATSSYQVYHVERIRDYMFSTLEVPPYVGDDYMSIISTVGKRSLIRDPNWEKWHTYTDPSNKFNSEIGRIENIRFIETGRTSALSGSLGTGSVLGESVVFGEDALVMAVAEDPHLRLGTVEDFGRKKAVAWYGILEFGVPWDTANVGEARVVHVTSS